MKYYRPFPCDHTVEKPLVCDVTNLEKYENIGTGTYQVEKYFCQGKEIPTWPDDIYLTTESRECDGDPDDVLQNGDMIPIFSKRLMDAINQQEISGFQFLPVAVYGYGRREIGTFYIANCTNMVSALDFEKSTYYRFPEDAINPEARGKIVCYHFVLKLENIKQYDVFRLAEQPKALFVSDKFVKMF